MLQVKLVKLRTRSVALFLSLSLSLSRTPSQAALTFLFPHARALQKPDDPHHRTTTGIISPLPPRPKADEYAAASNGGGINLDAFAAAKIEQARRQLYAGFLRGKVVGGTAEEQIKKELEEAKAVLEGEAEGQTKRRKSGRSEASLEAKRIRKAIRAAKRERRALESGSATPITGTEGEDSDAFVVVGSADTPLGDDSSASTPALVVELSKADRKALKKAKRALDLDLTSSSESTSSKRRKTAESTPQHLSPEEELNAEEVAYKEARSIARQAEKEEKRLRKVVKRALKEQKEASV